MSKNGKTIKKFSWIKPDNKIWKSSKFGKDLLLI